MLIVGALVLLLLLLFRLPLLFGADLFRAEGVLVEHVLAEAAANATQVGHIVRQLLDRLHLCS